MDLQAAILKYADSIDHPNHFNNEEREETCRSCRKYSFGRTPWPCVYRKHAEELRKIVEENSI